MDCVLGRIAYWDGLRIGMDCVLGLRIGIAYLDCELGLRIGMAVVASLLVRFVGWLLSSLRPPIAPRQLTHPLPRLGSLATFSPVALDVSRVNVSSVVTKYSDNLLIPNSASMVEGSPTRLIGAIRHGTSQQHLFHVLNLPPQN